MTPPNRSGRDQGRYNLINEVYTRFGFLYHVELSTRPGKLYRHGRDVGSRPPTACRGALDELGVK